MGLAWACTAGEKTAPVVSAAPPATEYLMSVRRSMPLRLGRLVIFVLPAIGSSVLRLTPLPYRRLASGGRRPLHGRSRRSVGARFSGRGHAVSTASAAAAQGPPRAIVAAGRPG